MEQEEKRCSKCGKNKKLSEFNFKIKSKGIYFSECKECNSERRKKYYVNNKERERESNKEYRRNNIERERERNKKYYLNNIERERERHKEYRRNNRDKTNRKSARRRSRKKNAMAEDSNKNIINTFYEMSDRLSKCLGIQFHVDHLIPLAKGGLHHENNLLPVPASINLAKSDNIGFIHPFYSHLNLI